MIIEYSVDSDNAYSPEDMEACRILSEKYFDTMNDPNQFQSSEESSKWIRKNIPNCLNVVKINDKVVGFAFCFWTSKKLKGKFMNNEITERQLSELMKRDKGVQRQAIYLCAGFIEPEFRKKGIIKTAFIKLIKSITLNLKVMPELFCETYSDEGKILVKSISMELNINIEDKNE